MNSKLLSLFLPICVVAVQFQQSARAAQTDAPTTRQCAELAKALTPCTVELSFGGFTIGCGVVISADGCVLVQSHAAAMSQAADVELSFSDGRKVDGKALGWSQEFGVGLIKILEGGPWPFVKLRDRVRIGEVCLALGFNLDPEETQHKPIGRLELMTRVSEDGWFTTFSQTRLSSHPLFSLSGELIGYAGVVTDGPDVSYAGMGVIRKHLDELKAGQNLDRRRLLNSKDLPQKLGASPAKMDAVALSKAKAASVRIGEVGKKPTWSGVALRGNHVVTCAHHYRLPGYHLQITFSDGQSAKAAVVGTNWVTDISVLKLSEDLKLPSAEFAFSGVPADGRSAVLIGYPAGNQKPLILEGRLSSGSSLGIDYRDTFCDKIFLEVDLTQTKSDIGGASGGGVFDNQGDVIGVLSSATRHELHCPRAELFQRNWKSLTAGHLVKEIDPDSRSRVSRIIKKLMTDLANQDPATWRTMR